MAHICNFIKKGDLRPCEAFVAAPGADGVRWLCGIHAPIKARLPPHAAGGCEFVISGPDHWCTHVVAPGDRLCPLHAARRERENRLRVARVAAEAEARRALIALDVEMAGLRIPPVHMPRAGPDAALGPRAPAPLDGGEVFRVLQLARLADDRQNVHTGPVVAQTNAGEEKLLAVRTDGKPVGLRVLRSFLLRSGSMQTFMRVANDVEHWYSTETCRRAGDRLYGRVMEGLWTLIGQQPEEQQRELKFRLWQEAVESVGQCCEGHIARLVNVMAGFDEAFKPRVSLGESIQTKMAELAGSEALTAAEKVTAARAFLTELAVSADDQAPWLEALE